MTTEKRELPAPVPSTVKILVTKSQDKRLPVDLYNEVRLQAYNRTPEELLQVAASGKDIAGRVNKASLYQQDAIAWALLSRYKLDAKALGFWLADQMITCTLTGEDRRTFKTTVQRLCLVVTDNAYKMIIEEPKGKASTYRIEENEVAAEDVAATIAKKIFNTVGIDAKASKNLLSEVASLVAGLQLAEREKIALQKVAGLQVATATVQGGKNVAAAYDMARIIGQASK